MKDLKKNFDKLQLAIKKLELSHELVVEAKKKINIKKSLENEIIKLKRDRASSLELIDQALKEIEILRSNVIKEKTSDG